MPAKKQPGGNSNDADDVVEKLYRIYKRNLNELG